MEGKRKENGERRVEMREPLRRWSVEYGERGRRKKEEWRKERWMKLQKDEDEVWKMEGGEVGGIKKGERWTGVEVRRWMEKYGEGEKGDGD